MRIAMISVQHSPLSGTGSQSVHVAELAAALARAGHDVTVHTRRTARRQPAEVNTPQGYRVVWRDKPPSDQSSAPGANNRSGASFWNVRDAPASWLDGDDFVPNEPAADRTDSRTRSRIPDFMDDAPPMPASAPARAPAGRRTSQPAAPARDDGRSPKNAPQAKARGTRLPFAVLFGFGIALSAAVVLTTGI